MPDCVCMMTCVCVTIYDPGVGGVLPQTAHTATDPVDVKQVPIGPMVERPVPPSAIGNGFARAPKPPAPLLI